MKGELNPFVAARVTGVSSIEEGRIFLLIPSRYREGDLKPIFFESVMYGDDGIPYTLHRAGSDMPTLCHCGNILFKGITPIYNSMWMCMSSLCMRHPYQRWVDYFPKALGPSSAHDFVNMFPHFIDTHFLEEKGKNRLYVDFFVDTDGYVLPTLTTELYRRWVDSAPVEYALTMKGLVSLRPSLVNKVRKLFLPRKT